MTVDNSALLNELLGNLKDKEAASTWGKFADEVANDEGGKSYWNQKDGEIVGQVLKVYTKPNFDKNGENPVLDLQVGAKVVAAEASHATLRKDLTRLMPEKGDWVRITPKGKAKGKNYYLYDVAKGATVEDVKVPF